MVEKGKPDKIFKQCPTCKGKKVLPWHLAKQLPKPSKNIKCTRCNGKGYEIGKPKK